MKSFDYLRHVFLFGVIPSFAVLWIVPDLIPLHHDLAGMINEAGFIIREPDVESKYGIPHIPVEHLFYGLPIYLATWTGIPEYRLIVLQCFLVIQLCTLLTCWVIYRGGLVKSKVLAVIWVLGIYSVIYALPLIFNARNIFSLREHLFIAFILPYLMLLCARLSDFTPSKSLTISAGIFGGIGIIFKPVYVFLFVIVEVVYLIRSKRIYSFIRLEALVIISIGSCYLLYWFFYTNYFVQIKYIVSSVQGYLNPQSALLATEFYQASPAIILLIHILFRRKEVNKKSNSVFNHAIIIFSACLGAIFVSHLQQRGFSHHAYPITVFTIIFALAVWPVISKKVLTIFMIFSVFIILNRVNLKLQMVVNQASQSIGSIIEGKTIAVISPHLRPYHTAILKNGAKWQFPIKNLTYLATEYKRFDQPNHDIKYIPVTNFSVNGQYLHQSVIKSLEDYPPNFIIVDTSTQWPMNYIQVNYLEALKMDEKFQSIWKNYLLKQSSCIQGLSICYDMYFLQESTVR